MLDVATDDLFGPTDVLEVRRAEVTKSEIAARRDQLRESIGVDLVQPGPG